MSPLADLTLELKTIDARRCVIEALCDRGNVSLALENELGHLNDLRRITCRLMDVAREQTVVSESPAPTLRLVK